MDAAGRLASAGVDTPLVDARLLLAHVLGVTRTTLLVHGDRPLTPEEHYRFEHLLRRRERREPLPYLLGTWEFMGLPFRVSPAALIPRPETEVLVEALAARLSPGDLVLDVGTGSGCIAIALARLVPGLRALALDLSEAAVGLASENARALEVADRVRCFVGPFPDVLAPGRRFDAIAANPPYIPSEVVDELQPEVRDHEPRLALDGGADGLALLRTLAAAGPHLLRPGGWLATEVHADQAPEVASFLNSPTPPLPYSPTPAHPVTHPPTPWVPAAHPHSDPWSEVTVLPDLSGIDRVVLARAHR